MLITSRQRELAADAAELYARYNEALDDFNTDLTVIQQNLAETSMSVFALKGQRVRLLWAKAFNHPVKMAQPSIT